LQDRIGLGSAGSVWNRPESADSRPIRPIPDRFGQLFLFFFLFFPEFFYFSLFFFFFSHKTTDSGSKKSTRIGRSGSADSGSDRNRTRPIPGPIPILPSLPVSQSACRHPWFIGSADPDGDRPLPIRFRGLTPFLMQ